MDIMADSALSSDIEQPASPHKAHRSKYSGSKRAKVTTRSKSAKPRSSSSGSSKRPAVMDKDAFRHHKVLKRQFDKAHRTAQAAKHQRVSPTVANLSD